jgi:hypothetical protein
MRKLLLSLSLLSALAYAPQASAAILTYTYTGTVAFGTDYSNVFGLSTRDLTGQAFTVVETFDTNNTSLKSSNGTTFSYQQGGSSRGKPSTGATATISIGGSAARPLLNDYADSTQNNTVPGNPSSDTRFQALSSGVGLPFYEETLQFDIYAPSLTFDYTQPFSLTTQNAAFSGSYSLSGDINAFANFSPATATLTVTNVPLPAALPLFGGALLGVAGLGIASRQKNRSVGA